MADREFARISQVDRACKIIVRRHRAHQAFDEIVDIEKTAGLRAVSVDRNVLVHQCLYGEIRDYASVVETHVRAVGIEYANDFNRNPVLPVVIHAQRFRATLAFVVA